jgi:hypothetical protein
VNPGPAVLVVADRIVQICHRAIVVEKRDSVCPAKLSPQLEAALSVWRRADPAT